MTKTMIPVQHIEWVKTDATFTVEVHNNGAYIEVWHGHDQTGYHISEADRVHLIQALLRDHEEVKL